MSRLATCMIYNYSKIVHGQQGSLHCANEHAWWHLIMKCCTQGQAQQAPVLQKDMPSVSSTSEELENWLQDYQPKPPAAREAVLITSSAYGKLVTWDSSSAGQLGEQESFKPLIVSRISSYGNVRTALMLQWLDNHSKTWSGMRKVNLGTHRWHLVIPLSSHPPYQCACRPGRERLLEIMVAVCGIEIMVAVCGM